MSQILTMRLAGHVASWSGARIDGHAMAIPIPTISMVTGMIGAALGVRRNEAATLQALQDAIEIAAVVERPGDIVVDFQTANMGLPHMQGPIWWHDGERAGVMERAGGDPERGLTAHRRLTADYAATILVRLDGGPFDVAAILAALAEPVFPVSLGQTSCFPSEPVAGQILEAVTLEEAVAEVGHTGLVYLPARPGDVRPGDVLVSLPHGRNWQSRQHGGSTSYRVLGG